MVHSLGHVVLKVRNLRTSEAFYADGLGMPIISRISDPVCMTFFTLGDHHDFAIMETGDDAPLPDPTSTGLAHVAFKIGDSLDELDSVKSELEAAGIAILYEAERAFTTSLHMLDPDQNEIELYIDTSDEWKHIPRADLQPDRRA
ncbi:MAG: VOC family protein [Acidimicrobiia bacterium]